MLVAYSRWQSNEETKGNIMLQMALGLFVIALIAAFFGFGGLAGLAAGGAQLLLFGFLVLVVIGLLFGTFTRNRV
jgi:uncharacterized membrane protein YtjA (UPF0391 family)